MTEMNLAIAIIEARPNEGRCDLALLELRACRSGCCATAQEPSTTSINNRACLVPLALMPCITQGCFAQPPLEQPHSLAPYPCCAACSELYQIVAGNTPLPSVYTRGQGFAYLPLEPLFLNRDLYLLVNATVEAGKTQEQAMDL